MKLCLVYNPKDSKLVPGAYCSVFKDMVYALIKRFNCKCFITSNCSASDIDADLIFFFDPHSSHHIEIEGVDKHPALKFEYWNDMHQRESKGVYQSTGIEVHKLGAEQRARRAEKRGVYYIISPVKYAFFEHFEKYFGNMTEKMLFYFPHAPTLNQHGLAPIDKRKTAVLGNGATWGGYNNGYDFRQWAFNQSYIEFVKHSINDKSVLTGSEYGSFLAGYAGALALCTVFPVPKYIEMPNAGCLTFAEYHKEYEELGFEDYKTCIYVNETNLKERVQDFLECQNNEQYKEIAEKGQMLDIRHWAFQYTLEPEIP
ncbi:MAG TPA: hypothetical protein ENH82_03970, partial [bacterium]|nr:hypothetical protein [bacterium]